MTINVSEARRHLSRLLDEVERGGEVVITRNGRAVARLVPNTAPINPEKVLQDIASLQKQIMRERGEKPNPVLIERSENRY